METKTFLIKNSKVIQIDDDDIIHFSQNGKIQNISFNTEKEVYAKNFKLFNVTYIQKHNNFTLVNDKYKIPYVNIDSIIIHCTNKNICKAHILRWVEDLQYYTIYNLNTKKSTTESVPQDINVLFKTKKYLYFSSSCMDDRHTITRQIWS